MDKALKLFSIVGIVMISASIFFYFVLRPMQRDKAERLLKEQEKRATEECIKDAQGRGLDATSLKLRVEYCVKLKT